jgi:hypothetical protein
VVCPAGFDGDKVFGGRGIRCDKLDGSPRSADCDGIVGWEWKRDLAGAEARCRNIVTGATGPTKPDGMTKIQHDLVRESDEIGWVLNKISGARDTWQRKVYRFPVQCANGRSEGAHSGARSADAGSMGTPLPCVERRRIDGGRPMCCTMKRPSMARLALARRGQRRPRHGQRRRHGSMHGDPATSGGEAGRRRRGGPQDRDDNRE